MNYNKKYEIGINGNNVYYKNLKNNEVYPIYGGFYSNRIDQNNSHKEPITLNLGTVVNGDFVPVVKNIEITWYPLSSEYTVRQNDWTYEMEIVKK